MDKIPSALTMFVHVPTWKVILLRVLKFFGMKNIARKIIHRHFKKHPPDINKPDVETRKGWS